MRTKKLLPFHFCFKHPLRALLKVTKAVSTTIKNFGSAELTIQKYYRVTLAYKNSKGIAIDYNKAYSFFQQTAELGEPQIVYATNAYMHYKGLGCTQDYKLAAKLLAQGAYGNRNNSMYFYGLYWRNGYDVFQNKDFFNCWLKKSTSLGYKQAIAELKMPNPENSNDSATALAQRIQSSALTDKVLLNQFYKVTPLLSVDSVIIESYNGYLIRYDWSGKYLISSKKLRLDKSLNENGASHFKILQSKWVEDSIAPVSFEASLSKDSLEFDSTHYNRKNHYSTDTAIVYDFKNAAISIVQKNDSVYLAGNIDMYSPDRKEPSKPIFVALTRNSSNSPLGNNPDKFIGDDTTNANTATIKLGNVYSNPFHSYVNVEVIVQKLTEVRVELYMSGQKVYANASQPLNIGIYKIRIEPSLNLASQTYILRLVFTNGYEAMKIIKE